jgi:hypothetical protein
MIRYSPLMESQEQLLLDIVIKRIQSFKIVSIRAITYFVTNQFMNYIRPRWNVGLAKSDINDARRTTIMRSVLSLMFHILEFISAQPENDIPNFRTKAKTTVAAFPQSAIANLF